jgi:hypothetical protein
MGFERESKQKTITGFERMESQFSPNPEVSELSQDLAVRKESGQFPYLKLRPHSDKAGDGISISKNELLCPTRV